MIWLIAAIYTIGFFVSVSAMHAFKKELDIDIDDYNPPVEDWDGEMENNHIAFVIFSVFWPLWWTIFLFHQIWNLLVWLSKTIARFNKTK